jgi:hypothetical protein
LTPGQREGIGSRGSPVKKALKLNFQVPKYFYSPTNGCSGIHQPWINYLIEDNAVIIQLLAPLEEGHKVDTAAENVMLRLPVCKCMYSYMAGISILKRD